MKIALQEFPKLLRRIFFYIASPVPSTLVLCCKFSSRILSAKPPTKKKGLKKLTTEILTFKR